MTKVTSRPAGDLQEVFHRAIVAFLKWHTENDMRAIYAYAAHHSHDFMSGFAARP